MGPEYEVAISVGTGFKEAKILHHVRIQDKSATASISDENPQVVVARRAALAEISGPHDYRSNSPARINDDSKSVHFCAFFWTARVFRSFQVAGTFSHDCVQDGCGTGTRAPFAAGLRASFHMGMRVESALWENPNSGNADSARAMARDNSKNLKDLSILMLSSSGDFAQF